MAAKVTFDPVTKIISVTQTPVLEGAEYVVDLDVKVDLYSDGKEDWIADSSLRKLKFPISAIGGDALPGGKFLGSTFFLDSEWKIRPYEATHRLRVNGNLYSPDGTSPFVVTLGAYNVFLEQSLSQLTEGLETGGGSGLTAQQVRDAMLLSATGGNPAIDAILLLIRDLAEADEEYSATQAIKRLKGTSTIILQKDVSGGAVANPPITITEP